MLKTVYAIYERWILRLSENDSATQTKVIYGRSVRMLSQRRCLAPSSGVTARREPG